ncbi:MAG TPA: hypothetical protein VFK12_00795 [Gammaproteobacteria bacterium]|nr:hypothetical protein [Gammaproteobacteria bacterium]
MNWKVCCVVLLMGAATVQAAVASNLLAPERRTLTASPSASYTTKGAGFGTDLSVGGGLAIIGDGGATINGQGAAGTAYLFIRNTTTGAWDQTQQLVDPGLIAMDSFGNGATDGNTLLVGAGAASGNFNAFLGAVYVYAKDASGQWQEIQKLQAADAQSAWFFGTTVALGPDFALISAPGYRTASGPRGQGAVYVFTKNSNGQWQQTQEITDPLGGAYDAFGTSIALDGDTGLVSANEGLAYVLTRDSAGVWSITATLNPPASVSSPYLTEPYVALQGDEAFVGVVGASADDTTSIDTISVYQFDNSLDQWQYLQSLDLAAQSAGLIGSTPISVHGSQLLVGTGIVLDNKSSWAVFLYNQDSTSGLWQLTQRINGQPGDDNSAATAFDGVNWLVSVPFQNLASQTPGVVYVLGPSIDLSLAGQADVSSIDPGQVVHITYTITNHDPALTATNVEVMLTVADATITYETVNGAHCTAGTTSTTLVCNVGDLAPDAMASVTVPVSISYGPGGFTTTARVSADQGDASPGDNSVSTTTLVQKPPATGGGGFESGMGLVFLAWLLVMNRYVIDNRSEINIKR